MQRNAPDFWRQEEFIGDWGGARTRLKEKKGVEFEIKLTRAAKHEVWPEIDWYFPLKERFRLFVMAKEERSGEEGKGFKTYVGGHLDYFFTKHWLLRGGYQYGFSSGSGDPFKEHRFLLELTYSKDLPQKFAVHDRNRQESRIVNGDFSTRFRNRLRLEREFSHGKRSLIPYASGEIFYDTRFDAFNRYHLNADLEFRFKKRTDALLNIRKQKTLDFYYMGQHDSRSTTDILCPRRAVAHASEPP